MNLSQHTIHILEWYSAAKTEIERYTSMKIHSDIKQSVRIDHAEVIACSHVPWLIIYSTKNEAQASYS